MDRRPAFEEGVTAVFTQWTALCLAVENEWGGPLSVDKANQIIQDVLDWFYDKKEHHADDLELELEDALVQDFNTECEDGSPKQVAATLVELHTQLLQGSTTLLEQIRSRQASGAAASKRQVVDFDGAEVEGGSSSGEDDDGDEGMDEDNDAPAAVALSAQQQQQTQAREKPQPVVDADGFEMVQGRRRGRR
ncbi:hypothetical protein MNEG_15446 [Monoraphidium neglectum]|uniref:Pre-rRNA-processing protein TSR2 n=1 Tax=Monoraphidium neglectum TaxID=145388 RepID=A0A0D2LRI1_9CHLO|nr:hypothetical protein MNEG_15446 [Monoraphidium neglectum]KIY92516.1 hypothetical protein MNEG_15446 [Monoraphidium neglectum]|eukprot:XP_013891536.1 hypothetical protein MNEG_15446 [Monoraphidium neglectum]